MSEKIEDIELGFSLLESWEDRYRYIIELGDELAPYPENARDAKHKVLGCVSQVWLLSEVDNKNNQTILNFKGDSDAHIVRGLVYIVLSLYSGKTAADILAINAVEELEKFGLEEHLTPQRSNGLRAMINRIRDEANKYIK